MGIRALWGKIRLWVFAAAIAAVVSVLGLAIYDTYQVYRQMIVEQQQQHLLLIARDVSQNLEMNISQQLEKIGILTQTPGFLDAMEAYYQSGRTEKIKEYIFSYMLAESRGPSRMYLLDRQGEVIFRYNHYPLLEEFDEAGLQLDGHGWESQGGIGVVFPISEHHYGMTLINGVYGGNGYLGTVVSVMDLEELYAGCVVPLAQENIGGIEVKDQQGTVIMHPNGKMLGFCYQDDIEGFADRNQYAGQRQVLADQYAREEGTALYHAYSNGIVMPEKQLSAFSRMNLWGTPWYVSAFMSYERAVSLEFNSLNKFGFLFGLVLMIVVAAATTIYVLMRNRQKWELQAEYLKQINRTLEELHQSREETRHYHKLTTIGTLAGGIAHEFNNLLTPILGYAEFLKEQMGAGSEYCQDLDEIYKAGIRAKEIIKQILPFGRKETDPAGYCAVNVDTVIHECVKTVRLILPANITIRECLEDQDVNVYGNATQLHQVFLNLLSNAIHSMEGNGGALTVSTRRVKGWQMPEDYRQVAGPEYVEVVVADTGCGMSAAIQRQIFSPFFTTKAAAEGTGLGLSVVQDILISHSGLIRVDSEPGQGSRFSVYIPVSAGAMVVPATAPEPEAGPGAQRGAAERLALLVVDDEERVLRYLVKRLERFGHQVDAYTDPQTALIALGQAPGRWQVAVIDYMMPQMKGTALARRMKIEQPELRIIMITGLVEPEALQMQQLGVIGSILPKPVDYDELLREIDKAGQAPQSVWK